MDFMDIARQRVTVRKYSEQEVDPQALERILEAGRWASTAVNLQPQRILVLDTPERLAQVRRFCTFDYDEKYAKLTKECVDEAAGKTSITTVRRWCCLSATTATAAGITRKAGRAAA